MIQMTLSHVYKKIDKVMKMIENFNFIEIESRQVRLANQQKLNKAYRVLDDFKAEIEREIIKNRHKRKGKEK